MYRIHYPYLATINLYTSEHVKLYNKAIVGLPESDRYDITISKRTDFYQEMEETVSTFVFKSSVLIVTDIYTVHATTEKRTL